jgi:tetratricopeptide (TPR) repeat protein
MSLRKVSIVSVFVFVFLLGTISAFGQGQVGGKVFMKDADGKKVPVAGAQVDCYRTDVNQSCRSVKTGKNGDFVILGIALNGRIILGVSGPNLAPTVYPETKVGKTDIEIEVTAGNGRVATEQEIRGVAARAVTGELTEEQKKELAELERKRKEIEAKNAEIESRNAQRSVLIKEGQAAYDQKDYDTAIVKFEEGYKLDPEFVGSAPTFLNNKAAALKGRAVETYNAAAKTRSSAELAQARPKVAKDFTECLTAALEAHRIAAGAQPSEISNPSKNQEVIKFAEELVTESFRILGKIRLNLAGYVGTEEEAKASVALYKSSLVILPKNADVLAGLTFALYTSSALSGSESDKQESLNYGAYYLESTDKAHSLRQAVTEIVDLIMSEGLKPQAVK